MRRRDLIATLGGAMAILPFVALGQQAPRSTPLIGALWPGDPASPITASLRAAFQQGLREDGYIEGQNVTFAERYPKDPDEITKAADELIGLRVDVMMAMGSQPAIALERATSSIPIVGGGLADPVADGLVASLSRPGGNLTGNTFIGPELGPKRLDLLLQLVPGISRIGGLQHPRVYSERTMQNMVRELQDRAKEIGVEFQIFDAAAPSDFDPAFEAMAKARQDALIVFPSPMFYVNYRRLVGLAASHRLPTIYAFREAVQAGGLVSYGADLPDLARLAAKYVVKILNGVKPADLPVQQPTKFEFVINLKTAKALGLTVQQSLLAQADELVE